MPRTLIVTLLLHLAVSPAWAGPQERANTLFVETVKLVHAAKQERNLENGLEQLKQARANLQIIIDEYPSTDLAVKLITGQEIGEFSIGYVESEMVEQRARIAAKPLEELLARYSKSQTPDEVERLTEPIQDGMVEFYENYGSTDYYQDLHVRFVQAGAIDMFHILRETLKALSESDPRPSKNFILRQIQSSTFLEDGHTIVVVTGEIVNVSGETKLVPNLEGKIFDSQQRMLVRWIIAPPSAQLEPGATAAFSDRFVDPPLGYARLSIDFANVN